MSPPSSSTHRLSQIRIRQLRLLVWLSEGLTLSRAAEQLHITAAAASAMLQELESSTGAQLFERDRRGARATAAGLQLAQRAGVLLREFELFESEIKLLGQQNLHLRLGVIPQVMMERVPALAQRYAQHYPSSLQVSEGTSVALMASVQRGELAAAVVRTGASTLTTYAKQGLQMDTLGFEQAAIAVPLAHPLAKKRRIAADDLVSLDWVLPEPGSYILNMLEQHFALHKLDAPRVMLKVNTTVQAVWCASRMGLAAAGPLSMIKRFAKEWQIKALPLALGEPIQLGLFYRSSQAELPQFQALRLAVLQTFEDIQ
jgi:DNA-binding transcriptional LysR family regulator